METAVKGKALIDFEKIINEVSVKVGDAAYDKGKKDGHDECMLELESSYEKSNSP